MISEYVLLLVLSVFMSIGVLTGFTNTLKSGIPRLSVRLEKHLITGYMFTEKSLNNSNPKSHVRWQHY